MFAGWLAQTAHAYPTWPIAVQQAAGPVLWIPGVASPAHDPGRHGPFGHTREVETACPGAAFGG